MSIGFRRHKRHFEQNSNAVEQVLRDGMFLAFIAKEKALKRELENKKITQSEMWFGLG